MGQTPSKFAMVVDQLAHSIKNGEFTNGDRLPPQRDLASKLGVSIGVITDAYKELGKSGLVTARIGDGTYVNCTDSNLIQSPEINMAFNVPAPVPEAEILFQEVLATIAKNKIICSAMMKYPSELGSFRHRAAFSEWLKKLGGSGQVSRVMLTGGAHNAIACVLRAITRPGDVIISEEVSYHGLKLLAKELRLKVVSASSDDEGLLADGVDYLAKTQSAKVLFCIPSLQMPTGITMSLGRRRELAAVAKSNKLLVIEDCVHALGQVAPLPALSVFLPEQSFLVGSFSKTTFPALRVGFIDADPKWMGKISLALRNDSLTVGSLMPEVLVQLMESGRLAKLIQLQRSVVIERYKAAFHAIQIFSKKHGVSLAAKGDKEFPFLWLTLPNGLQAKEVSDELQKKGVLTRPSNYFQMGRCATPEALRISLNSPTSTAEMKRGIGIIGESIFKLQN